MRTTMVLGLSLALLALVLVLPHGGAGTRRQASSKSLLAAARAEPTPGSSLSRSSRLRPPEQRVRQQSSAGVLSAIEAETDADRRSEALELAVSAVADADLRATLESLSDMDLPVAA